jgi:hypothetical protein
MVWMNDLGLNANSGLIFKTEKRPGKFISNNNPRVAFENYLHK